MKSTFSKSLTFDELYDEVRRLAFVFTEMGVVPGDVIVGYSPFNNESVIAYLASAAVGAVWSAVASESGVKATLER